MKLKQLTITVNDIVARCEEFQLAKTSAEKQHMDSLPELATKYLGLMEDWGRSIERWRYWKGANSFLFGSPIFIGRADTVTHIRNSLEQSGEFLSLPLHSDVIFTKLDATFIIKLPVC
jgi:hypothetical protein